MPSPYQSNTCRKARFIFIFRYQLEVLYSLHNSARYPSLQFRCPSLLTSTFTLFLTTHYWLFNLAPAHSAIFNPLSPQSAINRISALILSRTLQMKTRVKYVFQPGAITNGYDSLAQYVCCKARSIIVIGFHSREDNLSGR